VVRRVLQDPVQRYLLADEVGLGKTVEAGVLIRQSIIDGGEHQRVLVAVPNALVPQWRSELVSKFFLGHCLDKTVHVVSLDDGHRIRTLLGEADMLVIDEAHHLTDRRSSADPHLYRDVAAACLHIERVLLLSATPAIHNERGFLQMLHLLDPQTYPLDDEEGLPARLNQPRSSCQIARTPSILMVASQSPASGLPFHARGLLISVFFISSTRGGAFLVPKDSGITSRCFQAVIARAPTRRALAPSAVNVAPGYWPTESVYLIELASSIIFMR
jgi:hypothetical protein